MEIYPLTFKPVLKELIWGGQKLRTVLGKSLPAGARIGESWEISTHPAGISVIDGGPLAGMSLPEALDRLRERLMGKAIYELYGETFPLLVKFIDAHDVLSVQVHPDADHAVGESGASPKTEAWYIIDAEPGAELIRGVRDGITRERFSRLLADGDLAEALNRFEVAAGDVVFIPAGTIHAIGGGILLAEIQENSDTTYRVFDWNRPGLDGRRRPLHVAEALKVADLSPPSRNKETPAAEPDEFGRIGLVACDKFVMKRWEVEGKASAAVSPDSCEIVLVLEGSGAIRYGDGEIAVRAGSSLLLPAALGNYTVAATRPLRILWSCPI